MMNAENEIFDLPSALRCYGLRDEIDDIGLSGGSFLIFMF